jgi:hypothetical protein
MNFHYLLSKIVEDPAGAEAAIRMDPLVPEGGDMLVKNKKFMLQFS